MKLEKAEIEEILRKILTKEARERLGRLKLVKPELVEQLKIYLVQLYKAGKIRDIIDDEKLKEILKRIS
jgi:programmed cell death protein 5